MQGSVNTMQLYHVQVRKLEYVVPPAAGMGLLWTLYVRKLKGGDLFFSWGFYQDTKEYHCSPLRAQDSWQGWSSQMGRGYPPALAPGSSTSPSQLPFCTLQEDSHKSDWPTACAVMSQGESAAECRAVLLLLLLATAYWVFAMCQALA